MIRKIKFANFYSFSQKQEISFLAQKKETYDYYTSDTGEQITKVASFIGGNASGKTNVMRLFSFLSYFICKSTQDSMNPSPNIAFKTHFNNTKSSDISVEFEYNNIIYYYNTTINNNIILKEEVSIKPTISKLKKIKILVRNANVVEKLNKKYFPNFKKEFIQNIRPDISIIAFLNSRYSIDIINNIFNYFATIRSNINEVGDINNLNHQIKTLNLYLEDETIKNEMVNIVENFDIGLENIEIKKEVRTVNNQNTLLGTSKTMEESVTVNGIHKTKEVNNKIDFIYESRGTQSLFFTIANILYSLKHEGVVIIDEIELGLHPEALNKLIHYFIDQNKDKKSQIIFSSHSLGFMNQLDMHQIFLVEKDKLSQSLVYRLNQVENIRSDENFLAKYLSGAYGAFPKIRI